MKLSEAIIKAFESIVSQFGLNTSKPTLTKIPYHNVESDLVVVIGLTGAKRGTFTFEYDEQLMESLFDAMAPGKPFEANNEMVLSFLSEFSNMVAETALANLDVPGFRTTPSTVVLGKQMGAIINSVEAFKFHFPVGSGSTVVGLSIT